MSKHKSNVNPDHFKTAGRETQGKDVVHEVQRQQYGEAKAREKRNQPRTAERDLTASPAEEGEGRPGVSDKKGKQPTTSS